MFIKTIYIHLFFDNYCFAIYLLYIIMNLITYLLSIKIPNQ